MNNEEYIIGVDECGYGCVAGKLMIGVVKAPASWSLKGLKDSKDLTRHQRRELSNELEKLSQQNIIQYNLQFSLNTEIDELGLAACHKICITKAIKSLYTEGDRVIIDGNLNPKLFVKYGLDININDVKSIIKADKQYPTVMSASILAKHHRDTEMLELHKNYPYYDWENNMGYLAPNHKKGIKEYGFSPLHRRSYNVKL